MKKKKIIIISIVSVVVIAFIVLGVKLNSDVEDNLEANMDDFQTTTVGEDGKIFINGTVQAVESKSIYIDQSKGTIDSVSVNNGQAVNVGDVLFTYKNSEVSSEITETNNLVSTSNSQKAKCESNINSINASIESLQNEINALKNQGVPDEELADKIEQINEYNSEIKESKSQIEEINETIESYNSKISSLKNEESYQVKSDVSGIVSIVGNKNDNSNPFMKIASNDMCIRGTVNEKNVGKINVDDSTDLLIIATDDKKSGKISEVSKEPIEENSTDGSSNSENTSLSSYKVTITMNNSEGLIKGYHVQATVKSTNKQVVISKEAIVKKGGKSYVFKVVDGKLKKINIEYEDKNEDKVIVLSGLSNGDEILSSPSNSTKEGMSIE